MYVNRLLVLYGPTTGRRSSQRVREWGTRFRRRDWIVSDAKILPDGRIYSQLPSQVDLVGHLITTYGNQAIPEPPSGIL
jgi:hypothetical protein